MISLRTVLLTGFLSLVSFPLFCANISILIIETGLQDGKPLGRGEMTEIWETGLLNVFFEEGHIVTNARSFALKKKPGKELTDEIKSYITEAEDSGIDYFVLAYLDYETDTTVNAGGFSGFPRPAGIEFNMFNINPVQGTARGASKCIWTQHIDLRRSGYLTKEEQTSVRKAARSLIVHLGGAL
jgi:hypothetical protein